MARLRKPMTTIRAARKSDLPALIGLLCRAFDADPVTNWVLRQDEHRVAALASYFRLSLELTVPHGCVFITEDRLGTAAWAPPGKWKEGRIRQIWRLPSFLHAVSLRRAPRVLPAVVALDAKHPTVPHYYLFELAVEPSHQGRGIGGALLRHGLERCDREGMPAYLESSNPRNNPLYERHGFKVVERYILGGDGPPIWLMWREPVPRRPETLLGEARPHDDRKQTGR
jgi:ribosomal protein S18 acetylase RimI-like enzyme